MFTHRPWPIKSKFPRDRFEDYDQQWKKVSKHWWLSFEKLNDIVWKLQWKDIKDIPIRIITLNWLKKHGFPYKNLVIESGSEHSPEIASKGKNRFVLSQLHEIKIFVEDDLDKAKKLASICELVFLIDHPYNQKTQNKLPYNIIRVQSWDEIYNYFKNKL